MKAMAHAYHVIFSDKSDDGSIVIEIHRTVIQGKDKACLDGIAQRIAVAIFALILLDSIQFVLHCIRML